MITAVSVSHTHTVIHTLKVPGSTIVLDVFAMACLTQTLPESLTLDQLKGMVKDIYKPLVGKTFMGSIIEKHFSKVQTGGPRDVVRVDSQETQQLMQTIVDEVEAVSRRYKPHQPGEKVWKGITMTPCPSLWVESYKGYDTTQFTVENIKVLTDLNWVMSYEAIVNITLA